MRLPRRQDRLQLTRKAPAEITIEVDEDGRLSRRAARRLLAAILAQAMHDGMFALRLRASEPGGVSLSYLGRDSEGQPAEWTMTPPSLATYPYLLQCALTAATLEPGFPLRGVISCDGMQGATEVTLEVSGELEMCLRWGP